MKPGLLLIGTATERMIAKFRDEFELHAANDQSDLDSWLFENGEQIAAVATNGHDGIGSDIMEKLPNLKIISCYGVGYDAIDVSAAIERDIVVSHTPDVLNADVANLAILLLLATSRCLLRDDHWVRSGNWKKNGNAPLTRSIEGSKVGIVGLGRIGSTIADKLKAFDCDIAYHTRSEKPQSGLRYEADLKQLADWADTLIAIVPGGASTKHLINGDILDALGPQGTLINVARGSVVDEEALIAALKEGRLGWAGLDVFDDEPRVPTALRSMKNVVLTPHVASATEETRRAMGDLVVDNLVQFFKSGKAKTPVPECQ